MSDEIAIFEYDAHWPAAYLEEEARLKAALPQDLILAMEHFGSTAIPHMPAKPVIDIPVGVRSVAEARAVAIAPMQALGYAFWEDNPSKDRLFFVRGLPPAPRRTHHVHVGQLDGDMWQRLPFRDYLRAHPDEAVLYANLKRDLAARHVSDREAYTAAESEFVDAILAKCGQV